MRQRTYVGIFLFLVIVYIAGVLLLPTGADVLEKYQITQSQVRLINLAIVIPLVGIWLMALYGFLCLNNYASAVRESKEGKSFRLLAIGLMILAFSLPINSIFSTYINYFSSNDIGLLVPLTITKNYINLAFSLAAFTVLSMGAVRLTQTFTKKSSRVSNATDRIAPFLIALSAIFAWLITSKPLNQGVNERSYYLPSWLLVLTIVIPYLLAWKAGIYATYHVYQYKNTVKGTMYKKAFTDLAKGIGVIIFVSIFIQLILTSAEQLSRLNLTPLLLFVYVLLLAYAVGFGFVARGAKKLKRFEDV